MFAVIWSNHARNPAAWPWLRATGQSLDDVAAQFAAHGFAVVRQVASPEELDVYRNMHDDMQSGALATPGRWAGARGAAADSDATDQPDGLCRWKPGHRPASAAWRR